MLPPFTVRHNFLPADKVEALLELAVAREGMFVPSGVGPTHGRKVNTAVRISSVLRDFKPLKQELRETLRSLAPELTATLKVSPFETARIEVELAAHNDGAFYSRHVDTQRITEDESVPDIRVLSGVYYFHAQPKAFSGGALRLHALGERNDGQFVDIEPVHNSLVFFPSWMPHEVMPVSCPSKRFADSRFAINCWFRKAR